MEKQEVKERVGQPSKAKSTKPIPLIVVSTRCCYEYAPMRSLTEISPGVEINWQVPNRAESVYALCKGKS